MSDQFKTLVAYIVGVSILVLGWSVFKTLEQPLPVREGAVKESAQSPGPPPAVAPSRVAAD